MPDDNLTKKLNFELPAQHTETGHKNSKLVICILTLILISVSVNTIIALRQPDLGIFPQNNASLNIDLQKKLALKLEKQGLFTSSANAWKAYISIAGLEEQETALIWYRIGKLFQNNNAYENALESYYRSESFAEVDSISSEIAIRIQECLESMGKFSAMRHELADRVSLNRTDDISNTADAVIAEIGTHKITVSELDRRMENNIDQKMTMMAPYLPEEERNKQKEGLLKQSSTPSSRMTFLNQFIVEEILYRKARESNLTDDQQVRNLIKDLERNLLARLVLEKEYENRIKITLSDLKTYYEANKDAFIKDEKEEAFDAVKNDVYKALRSQKEQEIQQQLLLKLKNRYDVVIHRSEFATEPPPQGETKTRDKK